MKQKLSNLWAELATPCIIALVWLATSDSWTQAIVIGFIVYFVADLAYAPVRLLKYLEEVRTILGNDFGAGIAEIETQFSLRATARLIDERINVLRAITGNYPEGKPLDDRENRVARVGELDQLRDRVFALEHESDE